MTDDLPDADGMKVIETSTGDVLTIDAYDDGTLRLVDDEGGASPRKPASGLLTLLKHGEYYTRNTDVHGALRRLAEQEDDDTTDDVTHA